MSVKKCASKTKIAEVISKNSDCDDCSKESTCKSNSQSSKIFYDGIITECMATLEINFGKSINSIFIKFASAICELQEPPDLSCESIKIDSDYTCIGFSAESHTCYWTPVTLNNEELYVVIDDMEFDLVGYDTTITSLLNYLNGLGVGLFSAETVSADEYKITAVGYHDFGDMFTGSDTSYGRNTIEVVCTVSAADATLCNLLEAIDAKFCNLWEVGPNYSWGGFGGDSNLLTGLTTVLTTIYAQLFGTCPSVLKRTGNSPACLITGDLYWADSKGIRNFDGSAAIYMPSTSDFPFIAASTDVDASFKFEMSTYQQRERKVGASTVATATHNWGVGEGSIFYINKASVNSFNLPASADHLYTVIEFVALAKGVVPANCKIYPAGTDTIQGAVSLDFASLQYVKLQCIGTDWKIMLQS